MREKINLENLNCTIIIKTIKKRREYLLSLLKFYDHYYEGLKIAIVETADEENIDIRQFNNLQIIYEYNANYNCEAALYRLFRIAKTKYVIEQGDDDLILPQRLSLLVKAAEISKCDIVSFESLMINDNDRDSFCTERAKGFLKKSLKLSKLVLKSGLYLSTPQSNFFLSEASRLAKFKKKYMMTCFSMINRQVAKNIYNSNWLTPKSLNGFGEVTASIHSYILYKTIKIPIIVFLRLEDMKVQSDSQVNRENINLVNDSTINYALDYFKNSVPKGYIQERDIKDILYKQIKNVKKSFLSRKTESIRNKLYNIFIAITNILILPLDF